jgi:twinkle protein
MSDDSDPLWGIVDTIQENAAPVPAPGSLDGVGDIEGPYPDLVIWTHDGESAAAIRDAGYRQILVLVPAPNRDVFAPMREHADLLGRIRKIIIAGGPPTFRAELARRLGRHRVWLAVWPEGCADPAEVAQSHGLQVIRNAIENAKPIPIEGVNQPSAEMMLAFRHAPAPPVLTTGCQATDRLLRLPGEGRLIIVTGIPNHGKSSWLTHLMGHTAEAHGRRWAVFSPEFGEWQHLAAAVMAWRINKPFRGSAACEGMSDQEIADSAEWIRPRFTFLACENEDDAPTLDWFLEMARICVLRDGATDAVIDPWNELQFDSAGRTEAEIIGRALQRLRAFAIRYGCNVWIVAHPTKLRPAKPGEPVPPPGPYDINGSSNWANKADLIVTVHCPENVTEIYLMKSRFRRWGRKGGSPARLQFDPWTGRFRSEQLEEALDD